MDSRTNVLQNEIDKISVSTTHSDEDFMIHVLNNITEEYDVILDGTESRLMPEVNNSKKLTIDNDQDKLSGCFDMISKRAIKDAPINETIAEAAFTAFMK